MLAETPRKPSDEEEEKLHEKLLVAAETFLLNGDITKLSLDHLAILADASIEEVSQFFTNPESVATALTERYVELAGRETILDHTPNPIDNWQGMVLEILERGQAFYERHPAAAKLRFGSKQSAGVRFVFLKGTWVFAELIEQELSRGFVVPPLPNLIDDLARCVVLSDALWSFSLTTRGKITSEYTREVERAVVGYLQPVLGDKLEIREREA